MDPQTGQPPKKYFIHTFGCQMNEYDSGKMRDMLARASYLPAVSAEEADVVLLNTCSVRENPANKVFSMLGRLGELKREKPGMIIGVAGCVAQQEGKNILRRAPDVDLVFGTDNLFSLPEMLEQAGQGRRVARTGWGKKSKEKDFVPPQEALASLPDGPKGQVAIMKGCDNFCSFCIVPHTRGREVNRDLSAVVAEVEALVSRGAKEILLLGQNVNSYRAGGKNFVDLVYGVAEIPGLERLRYMSPHPKDFNLALAIAHRDIPQLCEQVHLPFQSGSDRILKAMQRRHTMAEYLEKVAMLRETVPGVQLSTDIIVGFPGEEPEDYAATLDVMRRVRFDHLFAFKYSPRPFTPAAKLEETVTHGQKGERLDGLLALHLEILAQIHQGMVGSVQEILVEGPHPKNPEDRLGRTRGNKSMTVVNCSAPAGALLRAEVTGVRQYSLIGKEVKPWT